MIGDVLMLAIDDDGHGQVHGINPTDKKCTTLWVWRVINNCIFFSILSLLRLEVARTNRIERAVLRHPPTHSRLQSLIRSRCKIPPIMYPIPSKEISIFHCNGHQAGQRAPTTI